MVLICDASGVHIFSNMVVNDKQMTNPLSSSKFTTLLCIYLIYDLL